MDYRGRFGTETLFEDSGVGVVLDEPTRTLVRVADAESLTAAVPWDKRGRRPDKALYELANAAVNSLDIVVFAERDRMYTIPDSVQAEARRGLKWRADEKRGGTSVGLNTARTLAKGGQIGIRKVRHIAKYFPRHEVDKKGEGYRPGEDGYPSNGRIAWALWGGDAAARWAKRIVESEDRRAKGASATDAVVSGGYGPVPFVDYGSFDGSGDDEFFVRVRLDGSGIDRAYSVASDGSCRVWDDGHWDDMGNVEHDFHAYDRALDDPYDGVKKIHVPIDVESAIVIAALADEHPMEWVPLSAVNPVETEMFERAIPGVDWGVVDGLSTDEIEDVDDFDDFSDDGLGEFSVTAAGEQPVTNQDGEYTPEERSEKASQQVRDQMGRFSKTGTSVVIGDNPDYTGTVVGIKGDTQEVTVQLQNGETVDVPANLTQDASEFRPVAQTNVPSYELNFSGILGEPRTPIDQPLAHLPGRLPPLTGADTNLLMNDWAAWTSAQRLAPEYEGDPMAPFVPKPPGDINSVLGQYYTGAFNPDGTIKPDAGWNPAIAPNVYNDPMLRDWLEARYGGSLLEGAYSDSTGWYREEKMSREEALSPENVQRYDETYSRYGYLSTVLAAAEEGDGGLTPETTDVPGMYLAIVAEDDPQAVMELVCLIPRGKDTTAPTTFKRRPGEWVRDDKILQDLKSATPPPVVVLDNEMLAEVTKQIDGSVESVTGSVRIPAAVAMSNNAVIAALMAAGGVDRNRGNAERLRRYWTIGVGGTVKIRWNTPGDWTRCYRNLAKYMGPRAKGYCALRHKEMTGVWPGSKYNVGRKRKGGRRKSLTSSIETLRSEQSVIDEFTLRARAESARSRMLGRSGTRPNEHGARFSIPLVIPEGVETGDGRIFDKGAISYRDLPLPLLWQVRTGQGHDGSVVVGQIFSMERTDDGIGNAYGVFDTGEFGREAERLVRNGFVRGVSADMDMFEADEPDEAGDSGESGEDGGDRIRIKKARVMAVTIVPKPAFQECFISIVGDQPRQQEEETVVPDGIYVEGVSPSDASALVACGMVASSVPVEPPSEWFDDPDLRSPTPLTVTDEGRVFGHIAAWHVDHIGMSFGTKPPRSRSRYSYFHTGIVRTAEGTDVPVGQLTLAGGHAGLEASAEEAVRHYDDTASAVADVHAGEDAFGIWVAGSLRPGVTPEQVRALRASAPSGDWRPIKGQLELVAVCQVNVPGFPIARARVASGQVMALVAAGASALAQMRDDPVSELSRKVERLELAVTGDSLTAAARELSARVAAVKKQVEDDDYMNQMLDEDPEREMAVVSREVRERLAKEGKALKDGSYPIRNVSDLKNAIKAYGRAKPGKRSQVRRHIVRRARGLGRPELIPEEWKAASVGFSLVEGLELDSIRYRAQLAARRLPDGSGDGRLKALSEPRPMVSALKGVDEEVADLTPEEVEALKQEGRLRVVTRDPSKYTPQTQPRDAQGKFRLVLARLKSDLGTAGLERVVQKVEEVENLDNAGNYKRAAEAADDLLGIIDRLDTKALNPQSLENVRSSSAQLGEVISNLPFAFGQQAQKIRFSDVPPALRKLMKDMIKKVEEKVGQEDADVATQELRGFMSGSDYYSQSEISSQMAKLLRLLT